MQITASGYDHLKFFSNRVEYNIGVAGDIWYRDGNRARKVYELVALNLRKDYSNKDKIKIIQLLMGEFNGELSAFKKSALIDSSMYVEENLTAI